MHLRTAMLLAASVTALPAAAQDVYVGDPAHTMASFATGHLGISWVHGRFNKTTTAKVIIDRAARKGTIDVLIDATSVDTGHEARDKHVRSADYLDVEKFPTIAFKSTSARRTGDGEYQVVGDLTVHGTTKPVTLAVEATPEVKGHFGGYVIGISASGIINREDFGMTWNQALEAGGVLVGKEIHFQIDAELDRAE